jgi:isochorismate synthase
LTSNTIEDNASFIFSEFSGNKIFNFIGSNSQNQIPNSILPYSIEKEPYITKKADFIEFVNKAVTEIRKGKFDKVVVSRIIKISFNTQPNLSLIFNTLCNDYPNAYVNFVHSNETGTWMGASPELLLKIENRKLETVSLAGTHTSDNVNAFGNKELDEQALVSHHILEILKQNEIKNVQAEGPEKVKAGNLIHLKTKFEAQIEKFSHSLLLDLVKKLHPTPAVGSLPVQMVNVLIPQFEKHSREMYAGYLGELSQNFCELYVNLRTMKITPNAAFLFVGSGITAQSIANNEWQETENKASTLLNVLKKLKYV